MSTTGKMKVRIAEPLARNQQTARKQSTAKTNKPPESIMDELSQINE